jgi:hypothetical protein
MLSRQEARFDPVADAGLDRIAARVRHSRISTLVEHYIPPLEAMQVTSSRHLGL